MEKENIKSLIDSKDLIKTEKKKTSICRDGNRKQKHFFGNLDLGLKSEDENMTGAHATVATVWIRPCFVSQCIATVLIIKK